MAAGAPVVGAQALSDIPEGVVERSIENTIKHGTPKFELGLAKAKFKSRIGAGIWTTPLFLSGLHDVKHAKNKKEERRGMLKMIGAGGTYAGIRGGIEAATDPKFKDLARSQKLTRLVGVNALIGTGSAALTGMMIGKGLQKGKKGESKSAFKKYVAPAAMGATIAGAKGIGDEIKATTHLKPLTARGMLATGTGKAAAGALATLVMSKLMGKALEHREHKEKKADAPMLTAADIHQETAQWAKNAKEPDILAFYNEIRNRGAEKTPANRAAYYALGQELDSRGHQVPDPSVRVTGTAAVGTAAVMGLAIGPEALMMELNNAPMSMRDQVMADALDRLYIQGKFDRIKTSKGTEKISPRDKKIYLNPESDPAVIAHEIGHGTGGELRAISTASALATKVGKTARIMSVAFPTMVMVSTLDRSFATKQELEDRAKFLNRVGLLTAAAQVPQLAEEAMASSEALTYLARVGATKAELDEKILKRLVPMFATYAVPAAIPFVAASILRSKAND